jgi:hypothetical protein
MKEKDKWSNVNKACINGAFSAGLGTLSLTSLLVNLYEKAAIFQTEIAKAPELTQEVYAAAEKVVSNYHLTGSGFVAGIGMLVAGANAASAIYYATRKD